MLSAVYASLSGNYNSLLTFSGKGKNKKAKEDKVKKAVKGKSKKDSASKKVNQTSEVAPTTQSTQQAQPDSSRIVRLTHGPIQLATPAQVRQIANTDYVMDNKIFERAKKVLTPEPRKGNKPVIVNEDGNVREVNGRSRIGIPSIQEPLTPEQMLSTQLMFYAPDGVTDNPKHSKGLVPVTGISGELRRFLPKKVVEGLENKEEQTWHLYKKNQHNPGQKLDIVALYTTPISSREIAELSRKGIRIDENGEVIYGRVKLGTAEDNPMAAYYVNANANSYPRRPSDYDKHERYEERVLTTESLKTDTSPLARSLTAFWEGCQRVLAYPRG